MTKKERQAAYMRRYRAANRERLSVQKKEWWKKNRQRILVQYRCYRYGITAADVERMLKEQRGRCAICRRLPSGKGRNAILHIDHCHRSGKVRGLLCFNCNTGLGNLGDSKRLLVRAIKYLEK